MIDELVDKMDTLFLEIYPSCTHLVGYASVLGGTFTLIYILINLNKTWGRGEPVDIQSYYHPIFMAILIYSLPIFIPMVELMLSPLKTVTVSLVETENQNIEDLVKTYNEELKKAEEKKITENNGVKEDDLDLIDTAILKVRDMFVQLIQIIIAVARSIAVLILAVLSTFYRITICLLSPIVIAISILPAFKDSAISLLKRYINVYLYVPLANVLSFIVAKVNTLYLNDSITKVRAGDLTASTDDLTGMLSILSISIMALIGYFSIPTLAGWIVESSGGGAMTSGANKLGKKSLDVLKK